MAEDEKRVGRPPLGMKPVLVRLLPDVVERIDAIAGSNQRPAFIRQAISRELARMERKTK